MRRLSMTVDRGRPHLTMSIRLILINELQGIELKAQFCNASIFLLELFLKRLRRDGCCEKSLSFSSGRGSQAPADPLPRPMGRQFGQDSSLGVSGYRGYAVVSKELQPECTRSGERTCRMQSYHVLEGGPSRFSVFKQTHKGSGEVHVIGTGFCGGTLEGGGVEF